MLLVSSLTCFMRLIRLITFVIIPKHLDNLNVDALITDRNVFTLIENDDGKIIWDAKALAKMFYNQWINKFVV